MAYEVGDRAKVFTKRPFQDEDSTAVDPTEVTFEITEPDGTVTSYVYGVDPEVVKVDTGDYYMLLNLSQLGRYGYTISGEDISGNFMGASSGWLSVRGG